MDAKKKSKRLDEDITKMWSIVTPLKWLVILTSVLAVAFILIMRFK